MNLLKIVTGQVVRFMKIAPSEGQTLYGINLVRAFESRYGFLLSPKTVEEFSLANGVTFRHGMFNKKVVVDQVKIYQNGILAEGVASTAYFYDFISDIIEWAANDAGIAITDENMPPIYHSILHVEGSINLGKYIEAANAIAYAINSKLQSYGTFIPPFQVTGMTFQSNISGRAPTPFNIERLLHEPFETNRYFSTSPLRTEDHLEVLAEVERVFIA